ncbi:hypothetical protein [Nocardioides abyssi]|uniref:Uncharacterized protein n=1 Tax=Nocardioides abyssi TaxID=3058370 RepID=A0ABT8EV50_9ACTN|nr:hypothetical protein [Nocardioides abyssi]MDN4162040.1 hypothetical protein [Nocardioides abyssi]
MDDLRDTATATGTGIGTAARPRAAWALAALLVVVVLAGCTWAAATADDTARVVQVSLLGLLGAGIAAVLVYAVVTPLPGRGAGAAGGRTSGSAWFAGGPVDAGGAGGDCGGSGGGDCG